MAGDWIKIRTNLCGDPAVKAMSRALKMDVFSIVGRLHAFWAWADQHTDSGAIAFTVMDDVDDVVDKRGFASEMVRVGWLMDHESAGIEIPKWIRHNGENAKKRCTERERKSDYRRRTSQENGDIVPNLSQDSRDNHGTLSRKNRDLRREEKRYTPISPQGDTELILDSESTREDSPLSRSRRLFRMRTSTPLDASQKKAWKKNRAAVEATVDEDWLLLEWWFSTSIEAAQYRRRDLATLLNNWNAEISRAAEEARKAGVKNFEKKESPAGREDLVMPEEWRDLYVAVMGEACPDVGWERLPVSVQRQICEGWEAERKMREVAK